MKEGKGLGRRPDLVGGGLVRSLGGWSRVLSLRERGERLQHDSRILGSADFVEKMIREADETLARQMRPIGGRVSVEEVIRRMSKEGDVREQEVKSGGQRRKISEVRAKIAYYLSRERGICMAEIARNLGVGTSAIAMAIKKEESSSGN
jgi:putative transposase